MKKSQVFIVSLLLQASCLTALQAWSPEDERTIREASNGQRVLNRQWSQFGDPVHQAVEQLTPFKRLPDNFGHVVPYILLTFDNHQQREVALPPKRLEGRWTSRENPDQNTTDITLTLEAMVDDYMRPVTSFPFQNVRHELVRAGVPDPTTSYRYYDGHSAYSTEHVINTYRVPGTQREYQRAIIRRQNTFPGHKEVILAHPFALGDIKREDYSGDYRFVRDLTGEELLHGGETVYVRDGVFYATHVTHEMWESNGFHVGFCLFSKTNSIPLLNNTQLVNGRFADGVYQLVSYSDRNNRRHQQWQRIGEEGALYESISPVRVFSPLGVVASRCNVPEMAMDMRDLQKTINRMEQEVQAITQRYRENNPRQVVVLGPTGAGKSTLITGLFRDLRAYRNDDEELRLLTDDPLPGFKIEEGALAGTKIPSAWYDEANNILYWDCPGFGDPEGPETDLLNAFAISKVFSGLPTKIVLAVHDSALSMQLQRGQLFYTLLNTMTNIFPNIQQIQDSFSLFVTQGERTTPGQRLRSLSDQLERVNPGAINITQRSRELLAYLNTHPQRVVAFWAPQNEGPYPLDRDSLEDCLNHSHFVNPLELDIISHISPETRELCAHYAQNLNTYLTNYMSTEASYRLLLSHFIGKVGTHRGTSQELRQNIQNSLNRLRGLNRITPQQMNENSSAFSDILRNHIRQIHMDEVDRVVEQITFLRNINPLVTYTPQAWYRALDWCRNKIQKLTLPPVVEVSPEDNAVVVKGYFLGATDIQRAIEAHPHHPLRAYSGSAIFLDGPITLRGDNLSLVSIGGIFAWQPVTLNLSGRPGQNGAPGQHAGHHGSPGHPGGSSGNIFMIGGSLGFNHVTLNLRGGQGGAGGDGARGIRGFSGTDGDLNKVTRTAPFNLGVTYENCNGNYYTTTSGTTYYYEDTGAPGSRGDIGGRAGAGGLGGLAGQKYHVSNPLNDPLANVRILREEGPLGPQGQPGQGGQGGVYGRNCQGEIQRGINQGHTHKKGMRPGDTSPYSRVIVPQAHIPNYRQAPMGPVSEELNIQNRLRPQPVEMNFDDSLRLASQVWREYINAVSQNENAGPFFMY